MDLFYKLLITEHILPTDAALSMAPFDEISAKRKVRFRAWAAEVVLLNPSARVSSS